MTTTSCRTTANAAKEKLELTNWLFRHSSDALVLIDVQTDQILQINDHALRLAGCDASSLTDALCIDFLGCASSQLADSGVLNLRFGIDEFTCVRFTRDFVTHDQQTLAIVGLQEVSSNGLDRDGEAVPARSASDRHLAVPDDIDRVDDLLDEIGAIIWESRLPFQGTAYVSRQLTPILGYTVDQWIADPQAWEKAIVAEDRSAAVRSLDESISKGEGRVLEYRMKSADGRMLWMEDHLCVSLDADGSPSMVRGLMLDVTAQKQAEQAFHRQKEQHQQLMDHAPVCIHTLDASGQVDTINRMGLQLIGTDSADDVCGTLYMDFVVDKDAKRIGELLRRAYKGHASHFQFTCLTHFGERTFDSNFIPIRDSDGGVHQIIGTSEDVTDLKAATEMLRIRERAIDSASVGMLLIDVQSEDFELIYCNPAFEQITGFRSKDVVGTDGSQLQVDDTGLTVNQLFRATMQSDQSTSVVCRNRDNDPAVMHCEVSVSMVRNDQHQVSHLVCFWNDITERIAIESQLRESEHLFRTLSVHSPNGVLLCDVSGNVSYINEEGARIVGRPASECLADGWKAQVHRDDRSRVAKEFKRLLSDGTSLAIEARFCHSDDEHIWAYLRANPRFDESGRIFGFVGSMVDITQRKCHERQLAQNEQRFRTIVESAPEAILVYDVDRDRFVDWNQNAIELFQRPDDDSLSQSCLADLMPLTQPDGSDSLQTVSSQSLRAARGENVLFECEYQDSTGRQFPCEVRLVHFPSSNQNLIRASLTDVTQLRAAQRKLTRFRLAMEHSTDLMYVIGADGNIIDVNQKSCDALGYSREQLLGLTVADIKQNLCLDQWPAIWQSIKGGDYYTVESVHVRKDGTSLSVEVSAAYSDATDEFIVAIARDITERKEASARIRQREQQLARVSRHSMMGELVAGIAHEVNQPLYSIVNFAKASKIRLDKTLSLLSEPVESDSIGPATVDSSDQWMDQLRDVAEWNAKIAKAATDAGAIIRRMANFVSDQSNKIVPTEVDDAILGAVELLTHPIRHAHVSLSTNLNATDAIVPIDRVHVLQIIVNLVMNAIEAIEQSQSSRREISITTELSDQSVMLQVEDSGPGFPSYPGNDLFEPFVSTKQDSMGMGLAIVKTIIETFDGQISIAKSQAGGAAVYVSIPLMSESGHV